MKPTPNITADTRAPNRFDTLMERLERAAAKGPQWIECEECAGSGKVVRTGEGFCICTECGGAGGYMTNPALALQRMRALELRESWTARVKTNPDGSLRLEA